MSREAGERLIGVSGLPIAPGVSPELVRDALCFIVKSVAATIDLQTNRQVRRSIETARNALARYSAKEKELLSFGFPMPVDPTDWKKSALDEFDTWLTLPKPQSETVQLRTILYPYLLALFQLTFGKKPTAYYYLREEQDGPTLAFIRQAAMEIDKAYTELVLPSGFRAASRFGNGEEGTVLKSLPEGDALRSAIETFLPRFPADDPATRIGEQEEGESDRTAFFRAFRLIGFALQWRHLQ
ncbi:hypothetical protein [Sulfitobacter aestuariivivens]|uniref:Uncharacterized protein n=1 Tax=Sulfitobacter aestuariivivens TaxID=2766981 RepID=A0A927D6K9_9RHOB|nr:hypothetical protein [Sulfitobacter aestuariivivens]MBD3666180.1 hypothetical protein [Sulfitobacter aestuariivivens]